MTEVVIIGSGPAGVSAALYTARAGLHTTVISMGTGALGKAHAIENYYGFSEPVTGEELQGRGIQGAARLGVEFREGEVVNIAFEDTLVVETAQERFSADFVVLSTGASRMAPKIPGIRELEGRGVSYCAVCDGFFYRGKDVCVLGSGAYALHEAAALQGIAASVTLLTNGEEPSVEVPDSIRVCPTPISQIAGEDCVEGIVFADGTRQKTSGVFIASGVAGSTALARKIGAQLENNRILVDETMQTNVPGLFAAGDCTGGLLQVAKAVYEGAKAGTQIAALARKQGTEK